jgi:hypothetical protein
MKRASSLVVVVSRRMVMKSSPGGGIISMVSLWFFGCKLPMANFVFYKSTICWLLGGRWKSPHTRTMSIAAVGLIALRETCLSAPRTIRLSKSGSTFWNFQLSLGLTSVHRDRRSLGAFARPSGAFVGHTEGVTFVSSKGDGRYVISNGKDQVLKLWDLRKMRSNQDFDLIQEHRYGLTHYDYR